MQRRERSLTQQGQMQMVQQEFLRASIRLVCTEWDVGALWPRAIQTYSEAMPARNLALSLLEMIAADGKTKMRGMMRCC